MSNKKRSRRKIPLIEWILGSLIGLALSLLTRSNMNPLLFLIPISFIILVFLFMLVHNSILKLEKDDNLEV